MNDDELLAELRKRLTNEAAENILLYRGTVERLVTLAERGLRAPIDGSLS